MSAILMIIAALAWAWLLVNRGLFWKIDALPVVEAPQRWPDVVAIIPARNEADGIGETVRSLLGQDYPGMLSVVVTDDHSDDGTADIARAAAREIGASDRLLVIAAPALPPGWAGKMWAQQQGLTAAAALHPNATLWLLTDADIQHGKDQLRTMVALLEAEQRDLASLMVRLSTQNLCEKLVIPAFVFFFRLLYPFRWVSNPANKTAGAAGGYMLVRRAMLDKIGGMSAISHALIDDCSLALEIKRAGGRLRLDLAQSTSSLRRYDHASELWMMIARSAYTQLRCSPLLLFGTVVAMSIVFLLPLLFTLRGGPAAVPASIAWLAMSVAYAPMLRYHRLSVLWAPLLPVIALFYLAATVDSARRHWQGRGGQWKGRAQAQQAAQVAPEKK